ncbi:MAG TPA: hypothetical protein VJP02_08170 [Candidatus Sulfotelmatobacter sp.]|nr:hypothetical protein [Candidatus Sulfotelmatobacter sp.]
MNALCLQIQQEKNYDAFEELTRQLHELVSRKEKRFPERRSSAPEPTAKAWKVMPAMVKNILPPLYPQAVERVEVTIPEADDLFREIRVENSFVDAEGAVIGIKSGTRLDVRLEAAATNLGTKAARQRG